MMYSSNGRGSRCVGGVTGPLDAVSVSPSAVGSLVRPTATPFTRRTLTPVAPVAPPEVEPVPVVVPPPPPVTTPVVEPRPPSLGGGAAPCLSLRGGGGLSFPTWPLRFGLSHWLSGGGLTCPGILSTTLNAACTRFPGSGE